MKPHWSHTHNSNAVFVVFCRKSAQFIIYQVVQKVETQKIFKFLRNISRFLSYIYRLFFIKIMIIQNQHFMMGRNKMAKHTKLITCIEKHEKKYNENQLQFKIECDLTCENWASIYGVITENTSDFDRLNRINTLKIDLSSCTEASPFCLMCLILFLKKQREDYKKNIVINLPTFNKNFNYKKGAFLRFLASQGFLSEMLNNKFIVKCRNLIDEKTIERFNSYRYDIDCYKIFPIKTYTVNDNLTREIIAKEIDEELSLALQNSISPQSYNLLSMQVYNIVTELIENVERHAYLNDEKKRFAIYIRKRNGAIHSDANEVDLQLFKKRIKDEESCCPGIDNSILEKNEYVLEIFFADIGMGLSGSLNSFYSEFRKKEYKYPIRELFGNVLKNGFRKTLPEEATKYGGLHFICRLLSESSGYIWCNEGKEWVGAFSNELSKKSISKTPKTSNSLFENVGIGKVFDSDNDIYGKGLMWCFRIPYSQNSHVRSHLAVHWTKQPSQHPVYVNYKYNEQYHDMTINHVLCRDDNFNQLWYLNGSPKEWKNNFDNTTQLNTNTYVWFPKKNNSKNKIYKKIDELIKIVQPCIDNKNYEKPNHHTFANEGIHLVIGDVDLSDLISYYYVLNNMSLAKNKSLLIDVVVITKQWTVLYFEAINGNLIKNDQKAKNFIENKNNNFNKIYEGIVPYALFIRKYYSFHFWQMIKEYQSENYFINAPILWSKEKIIDGYLDFERIIMFEKAYKLLIGSLERTMGYFNMSDVEFRNTDSISRRLCQDINSRFMQTDTIRYFVNVLTVCVTGYTKKAQYNYDDIIQGESILYNAFFAHPYNTAVGFNDLSDVSFLFVWPEKDFFSEFQLNSGSFCRIGKTSLISSEETINRIETQKIYKNIARNKIQLYHEIQQSHPHFLKYGHYCTDSHHYLIGFDLITYMKNSYLKKEGAFVFLLWKIIVYLSGKEHLNYISDLKWRKVLKNSNFLDLEKGGLVVYHSNTFTDYYMSRIKEIIPEDLQKHIIPLTFFETQSFSNTVSISPFTIKQIKEKMSSTTIKGILYIDSSFSTGRRMAEIENILLSSGCEKVRFLSLVDMRRLRSYDEKSESYWRLNIPRLDDSHCIICSVLKKLKSFQSKVDKELSDRIDGWIKKWQAINITCDLYDYGIEPTSINSFTEEGLEIKNSSALNIFAAEQLSETYNNDYVYFLIQSKTSLTPEIRIQLICTQLCLFGNQNSRQLQLSLLSELIGNVAQISTTNSYTSLAGITFISQSISVIYDLLNEILYENNNPKIIKIKQNLLNSTNMDLIITICYFVKQSHQIEVLLNDFRIKNANSSFPFIESVNEHILPEKELKLITKEFIGLLINELGDDHGTNINKFKNENTVGINAIQEKSAGAKKDIYRLSELTERLPLAMSNSRLKIKKEFYKDTNEAIIKLEQLINQDIENYLNLLKAKPDATFDMSSELRKTLDTCKKFYENIATGYFIDSSSESIEYLKSIIQKIENQFNKKIKVKIFNHLSSGHKSKWYYWHQGIEKEFIYLLQNIMHCNRKISEVEDEYMEVEIVFNNNHLNLSTVSWSAIPGSGVQEHFLNKNRLSKEQSCAFDVMFGFENIKNIVSAEGYHLLRSQMNVPACFQSLKGDAKNGEN